MSVRERSFDMDKKGGQGGGGGGGGGEDIETRSLKF